VWHDGGLLFWFPGADRWVAVFLAFQSQSWHTDDHTGNPIGGKTGLEPPRFDDRNRRLPAAEQPSRAVDLVAVRVAPTARSPAAVLLLNTTDQDIGLAAWSLATARDVSQRLAGAVRAGQTLAIDVAETFFDAEGGVVTLLDGSDLKAAAASYPAASDTLPGWHKAA
jgi:hypothetical protein